MEFCQKSYNGFKFATFSIYILPQQMIMMIKVKLRDGLTLSQKVPTIVDPGGRQY